jgi:hypothetical protein
MVRLPQTTGMSTHFAAHGKVYFVKKLGAAVYCLWGSGSTRMRFGTKAEIRSDARYVEENGCLPPASPSMA